MAEQQQGIWARFKLALKRFFGLAPPALNIQWRPEWSAFLAKEVLFYQRLDEAQRKLFEQRALLFLGTTEIFAGEQHAADEDKLLVAASAIIPVWGFPRWHYFNLKTVYLMPAAFNDDFQCGQSDSLYTGMVGTGPMAGKMALSLPALRQGFDNNRDKTNVGIHEFVHLIDMADGNTDGFPEYMSDYAFAIPWFELVVKKIDDIDSNRSNIDQYGATNPVEFFAVASEYFFERPKMLQKKHPQLFERLQNFYRQDVLTLAQDLEPRKKAPCPCGSGKRYKHCCMPED
ncbi:MAG: zinc-dependent peptidase [Cellvibrionaceae bacterium]|nr:zinc-dependent peptidase [Cellvibrionaceae bacterium]MCV6627748.1 zinc-dependent peptidase [Cellvibrionaceae bacterium]